MCGSVTYELWLNHSKPQFPHLWSGSHSNNTWKWQGQSQLSDTSWDGTRAVYSTRKEVHQHTQHNFLKLSQDQLSLYPLLHSTSLTPAARVSSSSWDLCALCSVDHCNLMFRPLWSLPHPFSAQHLSGVRLGLAALHIIMTSFLLMHSHAIGWCDDLRITFSNQTWDSGRWHWPFLYFCWCPDAGAFALTSPSWWNTETGVRTPHSDESPSCVSFCGAYLIKYITSEQNGLLL